MKRERASPPQLPLRFFRWFCHPQLRDSIEGDLVELYRERVNEKGKRKAAMRFVIDVLLLFRPGIIKPTEGYQTLTNYGMVKNYFKIGWRNLVRNKAYSMINVAGLALSMTCCIYIFLLVTHNLSFDNFHANSDRIYRMVTEMHRDVVSHTNNVPSPLGEFFRNDYTYGEKVARVFTERDALITLREGSRTTLKETEHVTFSEPVFFEIFNFPLLQGNKATVLREPNTAIVTERIARKYFGDEDPIGKTIWVETKFAFTITGILKDLPANTDFTSEIFLSYSSLKEYYPWLADETSGWGGIRDGMQCYVLLQPTAPVAKVEEVLTAYVKVHRANSKNVHHYKLQPLNDFHFNAQYGGAMPKDKLWTLSILGLFLIVTSCVNFVNLATAQALRRSKEVGVRKVLGSFKIQLFWQFIFETGIIVFTAIVVAAAGSYLVFPLVSDFFNLQLSLALFKNWNLLLFAIALGIAVTVLAGYYPGLILAGFKPVAALKGKISQQHIGGFNTRRTLIVAQFALSQVLIIGMLVITNQMEFARESDLGFDKEAMVMIQAGDGSTASTLNTLKNEIARVPGIEKIALCFTAPSSQDDWGNSIRIDNNEEEVNFRTSIKAGDADYVSTFGLDLVAGRNLTPSDTVREMLVNEALVRKLGFTSPDEALGHIIKANGGSMQGPIVGVIKDFHDKSFHEEISAILVTTSSENYAHYGVKLNLAQAQPALQAIEKIWLQQHPEQLFQYEFLDESIARFYETEETILKFISVVSLMAILIGALGLYGLVSFMVSQKIKEIGIRKVLGGSVNNIMWLFGKEFIRLIVVAFLLAAPLGWWLMNNWLKEFQFQIQIGAWTFIWAIGCSLVVAAITVSYQVISTAHTNPVNSLRSE